MVINYADKLDMMKLNKNKLKRLAGPLLGLALIIMTFQNMTLAEFNQLNISEVDEEARREQARELLGAYYNSSVAKKFEVSQYLNYLIFKKVDGSLSAKYKAKVPELVQTIIADSQAYDLDPIFILAVIQTESTFNPKAKGTSGELGLMQILPNTAQWIAKRYGLKWKGDKSLYDPVTNVRIGIRYFAHLRKEFPRSAYHYLPAYNMGPKNVRRLDRKIGSVDHKGKPKKREYAVRVMKNYDNIYVRLAREKVNIERLAQQ